MAEQLGGDHEVGAAAHECGGERVSEHVSGHMVVEPAAIGDARDHGVGALGAQPVAALVEKQRGAVFRSRPVAALLAPAGKALRSSGWIGTSLTRSPLP